MKTTKRQAKAKYAQNTIVSIMAIVIFILIAFFVLAQISARTMQDTITKADTVTSVPLYQTLNGRIYFKNNEVTLRGINWYGFESYRHIIEGLTLHNWKELIQKVQDIGFNAVRIPICPETLRGVAIQSKDVEYYHNEDLKGLNSLQVLDKVVNELNNRKMFFLLDHHVIDCITPQTSQTIPDLWTSSTYSESKWINDLTFMAKRYRNLEYFVGIDLKNEPHGAATWGMGKATDWNSAAERAGKAVLQANNNILIFIEGIGENPTCSSNDAHVIGSNFEPHKCYPISNTSIPKNKRVYSPHIYGPYVTNDYPAYFKDPTFPSNMPTVWDRHFGYLKDGGFTVVPGEFGSWYGTFGYTDPVSQKDKKWMDALLAYFERKHICSSFYWALNPYGTGTGGVLDWSFYNEVPEKVKALQQYFASCTSGGSTITSIPAVSQPVVVQPSCTQKSGEYCENWIGGRYYCHVVRRYYGCGSDRYVDTGVNCCGGTWKPTAAPTPTVIPQSNLSYCVNYRVCHCDGLNGHDSPGKCGECGGSWCDGGFCHCPPPAKTTVAPRKSSATPTPATACITGKPCGCNGLNGNDPPGYCGTCGGKWCDGGRCHC
jgi:endoglucanase